jgi:hypothetical protein
MRDATARPADRLKAAEMVVDRGWGRPVTTVNMETSDVAELRELTMEALLAIAAGQVPSLPVTLDGEVLHSEPAETGSEAVRQSHEH